MPETVWINACLLSLLLSAGVFALLRRSGLRRSESVLLALVCFPAPLASVIHGTASFVYAIDLATPFAIYAGCNAWGRANANIKNAAVLIMIGAGMIPFLIATAFSGKWNDILYNSVNVYRLAGAMMLMVLLSAACQARSIDSTWWRLTFCWISIVLLIVMVLQGFAGVNTDVFDSFAGADVPLAAEIRFSVLGLFRGSLGILGLLAVCAYLAGEGDRGWKWFLSLIGAACGFGVIILAGSKTSLVAAMVITGLRVFIWRRSRSMLNALFLFLLVFAVPLIGSGVMAEHLSAQMVRFLSSGGQQRETLDTRLDVWYVCERAVLENPIIAFGVPLRGMVVMPSDHPALASQTAYLPGVYHSEYLSVFMLGGVWSATAYLSGLWLLGKCLLSRSFRSAEKRFALLVFAGCLIESTAVAHLAPGLYFACTVPLCAALYGLGSRAKVRTNPCLTGPTRLRWRATAEHSI